MHDAAKTSMIIEKKEMSYSKKQNQQKLLLMRSILKHIHLSVRQNIGGVLKGRHIQNDTCCVPWGNFDDTAFVYSIFTYPVLDIFD